MQWQESVQIDRVAASESRTVFFPLFNCVYTLHTKLHSSTRGNLLHKSLQGRPIHAEYIKQQILSRTALHAFQTASESIASLDFRRHRSSPKEEAGLLPKTLRDTSDPRHSHAINFQGPDIIELQTLYLRRTAHS